MPEFILDDAGTVDGREFSDLDAFTQGYIEALFFTDCDPSAYMTEIEADHEFQGGSIPADAGFSDLHPESLARIIADCAKFQASDAWRAFVTWRDNDDSPDTTPADDEQAGRDFWYTRNGHGVGFWDRPAHMYGPHQDALDKGSREFGGRDASWSAPFVFVE